MLKFQRANWHFGAWRMLSKILKKHRLKNKIQAASIRSSLPFELVCAVIWKESKGDRFARRYEDGFYIRYIQGKRKDFLRGHFPKTVSVATECRDRAYSYGLMQVLLQVAREFGFESDNALDLMRVETNLEFGCLKLARCIDSERDLKRGIARYNGDPNSSGPILYATDVLRIWETKEFEKLFI